MGWDAIICTICEGGRTSDELADQAGRWLATVAAKEPHGPLVLRMEGFDDDPRSLWDIPEAKSYLLRCVRAAGLTDWRSPLTRRMSRGSLVLLAMCGALGEDSPYVVTIDPDVHVL